jgi:hypothetical protein
MARACGDEALAESAQPVPAPANATTLAASVIFSLGGVNTCPGRIDVLPDQFRSLARSSHRPCAPAVHCACTRWTGCTEVGGTQAVHGPPR